MYVSEETTHLLMQKL